MTDTLVSILVATLFKESSISIITLIKQIKSWDHTDNLKIYLSPGASTILTLLFKNHCKSKKSSSVYSKRDVR
jgi:hypothetical protein